MHWPTTVAISGSRDAILFLDKFVPVRTFPISVYRDLTFAKRQLDN